MPYINYINDILKSECTEKEYEWIQTKSRQDPKAIRLAFVMAHRQISNVPVSAGRIKILDTPYSIDLSQWSRDQLGRTFLVLSLERGDANKFYDEVQTIFKTADNRESQAIYAAMSLFSSPSIWIQRATEAIRSNVGLIFDAMAFNNPFPAMHFDDVAWNQLVLKTIFSDKSIWRITGLAERRNEQLARTLSDFAHERWAAGRTLPADVWFLAAPFPGKRYWEDVETLLSSDAADNQNAGYLLWKEHNQSTPDHIKDSYEKYMTEMNRKDIRWSDLT